MFGLYQAGHSPCEACIGTELKYFDLSYVRVEITSTNVVPHYRRETQIGNKALRISSGAGTGQYVFVAAVPFTAAVSLSMSLQRPGTDGTQPQASGITGIRYFNANVEVDAKNDSNFVIQGSAQVAQGRSRSSNDDPNLSFKNENVVIASSYA